jgi:KaiC/GvpD/RAD55 family RecA-like ATPase
VNPGASTPSHRQTTLSGEGSGRLRLGEDEAPKLELTVAEQARIADAEMQRLDALEGRKRRKPHMIDLDRLSTRDLAPLLAEMIRREEAAERGEALPDDGTGAYDWPTFWKTDYTTGDWLVEPIIPAGSSVAMFGPAGCGKSELALCCAVAVATGVPILGRPAGDPKRVMYCDFEMGPSHLKDRLSDLGLDEHSHLDNLRYYQLLDLAPLDTPEGGAELLRRVRREDAEWLVIDTTSRVLSGPENDADTVRDYHRHTGRPLKADGRTVLRVDHAGKDLTRGQRGSSAKNDDVDLIWRLTRQEAGARLIATKRRDAWVPEKVEMRRTEEPLRYTLVGGTWPEGTEELAQRLDRLAVPLDAGRDRARQALNAAGIKVRNNRVSAAISYRKRQLPSLPEVSGTDAGTGLGDPSGTGSGTAGDRSADSHAAQGLGDGDSYGDRSGQVPAARGDRGVSLHGDTLSRARPEHPIQPTLPEAEERPDEG